MSVDIACLAERILEALPRESKLSREELGRILLAELPRASQEFLARLGDLVQVIADRLNGRPVDDLREKLKRLSWLGRTFWTADSDDPRIERTGTTLQRGEEKTYPVDVRLGPRVLRALLQKPQKATRVELLRAMGTWELATDLDDVLEGLELEADELVVLLGGIEPLTRRDFARGQVLMPVFRWICERPERGRDMTEAWFEQEAWVRGLEPAALQVVIEATLEGLEPDDPWKAKIVRRLAESARRELLELAANILGFDGTGRTPAGARHAALLEFVDRYEQELLDVGAGVLARDAIHAPLLCWEAFGKLREGAGEEYLESEPGRRFVLQTANLAWSSLRAKDKRPEEVPRICEEIWRHADILARVPTGRTLDLEMALDDLLSVDPKLFSELLVTWLHRPQNLEAARQQPLDEIFPGPWRELGDDGRAGFFLDLAVRRGPVDRRLVVPLLQGGTRFVLKSPEVPGIPLALLRDLGPSEAEALVHVLLTTDDAQGLRICTLYRLAESHPSLTDLVLEGLRGDGYADYPGEVRRHLELWEREEAPEHLQEAGAGLRSFLKRQAELSELTHRAPELQAIRPARAEMDALWADMLQRAQTQAFERSLLGRMGVPIVPLARGRQWTTGEPGAEPRELQEHSYEIEVPGRRLLDPVEALIRAAERRRMALEVLGEDDPETLTGGAS